MTPRQLTVKVLQHTRLNRLAHRLYYRHFHGFKSATSTTRHGLDLAFAEAARLGTLQRGDYYEFGVFKGYSFLWAQQTAQRLGASSMRFFGFDSFQGLPEVVGRDRTENDDFYKGQYTCPYQQVRSSLDRAGVDWDRTVLVEGFFHDSLHAGLISEHAMRPVAVALIDCDLYASTVDVLRFIDPLLMDRSILIFDDWNCFRGDDEFGQRKATAEFLESHPNVVLEPLFEYGSWGKGFLLRSIARERSRDLGSKTVVRSGKRTRPTSPLPG